MRIAVPVDEDKESIVKRTGHAPFFAIFENGEIVDFVKSDHGDGNNHHSHKEHESDEHHISSHKKDISYLAGCDIILVQMVGEHMQEALKQMNIKIKKIRQKDGATAVEAVTNYLNKNI